MDTRSLVPQNGKAVFPSTQNAESIRDLMKDKPKVLKLMMSLAQELLREEGALSPADREIIALYVSVVNHCEYCLASHYEFALSLGADEDEITSIASGEYEGRFNNLFRYLELLSLNPTAAWIHYEGCIRDGYTEEQIKEAVLIGSMFNMFNRIVEAHGLPHQTVGYQESATRINAVGYDGRYVVFND